MRVVTVLLYMTLILPAFHSIADEKIEMQLIENLQQVFPDINISHVKLTPIDNLYEVMIDLNVIYITGDGRFILKGDLIDMEERRNLSEAMRSRARIELLEEIPVSEYIEFAAKDSKDTIYVFTDVDCGYCRKLHRDIPKLNENAITVRYLAYPRGGIHSPAYQKMVDIWCADDRPQSLTDAKKGISVKTSHCENPVAKQYALGQMMGLRGTPAIFLDNGQALSGYVEPSELFKLLGQ